MYDSILIPTDGSDGTEEAVSQGIELARRFDATVHVLFVVDERSAMTGIDMVNEDLEQAGEDAIDTVATDAEFAGVEVERHLRRGVPHEEILDAAADYGVDIIVIGSHGQTGVERFLTLGSTAERVVRRASLPVLTAPLLQ